MWHIDTRYIISTIFGNILTCIRGANETSLYFDVPPPSLHEYFAPLRHGHLSRDETLSSAEVFELTNDRSWETEADQVSRETLMNRR